VNPIVAEVCVLGDGPAGASLAFRLARLGHDVVLIGEGLPHHRRLPHSISPGIRPFLELLDLKEPLNAFATECGPPDVRWETAEPFEGPASVLSGHLVDRSRIDVCLRDSARRAGVRMITTRIGTIPARHAEGGWRIPLSLDTCGEVQASFLVVATGRKSLLFRGRERIMPPLLALHSRWKLPSPMRPRIAVEALRNGWVWCAKLADGSCYAVVFMDPLLRSRTERPNIERSYLAFLSEAAVCGDFMSGSRMDTIGACDASALLTNDVIGSDWMLVGDSAVALEPISAQGIQVALKLGCQGAVVIHTLLSDASSALAAEIFYRNQCRAIATRHSRATREFYAGPKRFQREPFWMARASYRIDPAPRPAPAGPVDATTLLRLSTNTSLRELPCLVGDRICLQVALDHPNLDGPASHLGDVAIAPLLVGTTKAQTATQLCRSWTQMGLAERPLILLQWFVENGILVPITGAEAEVRGER
jgi:flavin-dependent dehydrogenase